MISYLQSFLAQEEVLIIYIRTEKNCMSFWIRKSSPSSLPSSNSPTVSETDAWSLGGFLFGQYLQSSLYFYLLFFFKHQKCILSHCGGQESKFKGWAGPFFWTLQGRIHPASLLALGASWCSLLCRHNTPTSALLSHGFSTCLFLLCTFYKVAVII